MKKTIIFSLLVLFFAISFGQEKYITKKGSINFEASVPSFEEVKAKNDAVTAIFNFDTGEIAALALIKGFRFKNALMEEHFNENYIESDEYPKAKFKGNLLDYNKDNIKSEYKIKGTLTLHGVSKEIETLATLQKDGDAISITSSFQTKPEDYNIKIPGIVSKKIAKEILVSLQFNLTKK